jgi:hypothetical protein
MADKDEFKFPDELEVEAAAPDIEVDIVDDTPPQDRGRVPLPKEIVEELESDDLTDYSDKVKKRLMQMRKLAHDERREKEKAAREKDEAVRFAQQAYEENKRLKDRLGRGEKMFVEEVTKAANTELESARSKLKQAAETGDPEQIAQAQEALTDAKLKLKDYQNFKPSLQEDNNPVQTEKQVQTPTQVTDPKAEKWREKNTWFGVDEEMTALALGLHEKLVRSGVDPRSDDYYDRVNTTMKKRFPEYFEDEPIQTTEKEEKPAPRTKPANVVAPATRSTAPRQVKLTPTQVSLAKRLGLTPEAYAKELMKLEANNG